MNELKENRWSFKSTSSIDKKLEDSNSTSRTASLNLATTEEEAKSKFVRTRLFQGLIGRFEKSGGVAINSTLF